MDKSVLRRKREMEGGRERSIKEELCLVGI